MPDDVLAKRIRRVRSRPCVKVDGSLRRGYVERLARCASCSVDRHRASALLDHSVHSLQTILGLAGRLSRIVDCVKPDFPRRRLGSASRPIRSPPTKVREEHRAGPVSQNRAVSRRSWPQLPLSLELGAGSARVGSIQLRPPPSSGQEVPGVVSDRGRSTTGVHLPGRLRQHGNDDLWHGPRPMSIARDLPHRVDDQGARCTSVCRTGAELIERRRHQQRKASTRWTSPDKYLRRAWPTCRACSSRSTAATGAYKLRPRGLADHGASQLFTHASGLGYGLHEVRRSRKVQGRA